MNQSSFIKMALPVAIASVLSLSGCSDTADSITDTDGNFTINMSGGTGYNGGNAGSIDIDKDKIGHLKIIKTQQADASFTPLTADGYMGAVPLIISTDTTVEVLVTDDPRPATGTPYFISGNSTLYLSTGSGVIGDEEPNGEIPTGITINSGATLTIASNGSAYIYLDNDLVNNGSLTTVNIAESTTRTSLYLYISSYIGAGSILNAGQAAGQSGGTVYIQADYSILNKGVIDTSGADDDATTSAGHGGSIYLEAYSRLENTANFNSSGGTSTNEGNSGGGAGDISLYASGDVLNNGDLLAQGGNGITAGGSSDNIYIESWNQGNTKNSGNLYATGGNATAGDAGNGSSIYFETENATLINSGHISTAGGSTTAEEGNGGYGGRIDFDDTDDDSFTGDFIISGNMNTSGGNAGIFGSGGTAGSVDIELENEDASISSSRKIILYGYTAINAKGGDGVRNGGQGGSLYMDIDLYNDALDDDDIPVPVAVINTDITNEANFDGRGGNIIENEEITEASAGRGGYVHLEIDYDTEDYPVEVLDESYSVSNSGDIDLSAGTNSKGNSSSWNSSAGSFNVYSYNNASNTGSITSNGGNDISTGLFAYGGRSGSVYMDSLLAKASNSAAISINGGDAEYSGGYSRGVNLYGESTSNSGNITANGGNANPEVEDSVGGNAGSVILASPHADDSQTGSISQIGGAGFTAGLNGSLVVKGLCSGPDCGDSDDDDEEYYDKRFY